jgi:transposase
VAYFNPRLFLDARRLAKRHLKEFSTFIEDLNRKLSQPRARRDRDSVAGLVNSKLRSMGLVEAYKIEIREEQLGPRTALQVKATLDQQVGERRRRHDGFNVLVAHPCVDLSPEECCRTYRAKDQVEKDFQTIKSVVELRPVRHQTDPKVRAHVTLCMLALLLERALGIQLGGTRSPASAIEKLKTCCLNRYTPSADHPAYLITNPNQVQQAILKQLRMTQLADDVAMAEQIIPRG